ncbi:hypothetical protein N0Y54_41735 [Nostoc punctiforme UO1]
MVNKDPNREVIDRINLVLGATRFCEVGQKRCDACGGLRLR